MLDKAHRLGVPCSVCNGLGEGRLQELIFQRSSTSFPESEISFLGYNLTKKIKCIQKPLKQMVVKPA